MISDTARGDWLLQRVGQFSRVGGAAGRGFEAYARVLHPVDAYREDRAVTDQWGDYPVLQEASWSWAEAARRTGASMHPLVQWTHLTGIDDESDVSFPDGWRISPPEQGWLEPTKLAAVTEHLAAATTTPDQLVAGFWDGWGDLNESSTIKFGQQSDDESTSTERVALQTLTEQILAEYEAREAALVASLAGPRLAWPHRNFILLEMSLRQLGDTTSLSRAVPGHFRDVGHTPQLLWPEDHAWVLASEIDWDSTIVAGPHSLINAVLADDRFEAFAVEETSDLTWSGDTINDS